MNMHLIVVRSFDGLARGHTFMDLVHITPILNTEWAHSVVRILAAFEKRD